MGYEHLTARNKNELETALPDFVSASRDKPVALEVFTKMKDDGEFTLSVYRHPEKCIRSVSKTS